MCPAAGFSNHSGNIPTEGADHMQGKIFSLQDLLLGSGGISFPLASCSIRGMQGRNGTGSMEKTGCFSLSMQELFLSSTWNGGICLPPVVCR